MRSEEPAVGRQPTRRELIFWGYLAGSIVGGTAAMTGCGHRPALINASNATRGQRAALIHVAQISEPTTDSYLRFCDLIKLSLESVVASKVVFIQSSYLKRNTDRAVHLYSDAIGVIIRSFLDWGARAVILCTDLAESCPMESGVTLIDSATCERWQLVYCATRLSGRLCFQVPDQVLSADVLVSAPLSDAKTNPLLASANLLGLVPEHAKTAPSPDQLRGPIGDFAIDVVSTLKPHYTMNFLATAARRAISIVTGFHISTVDAVTCRESGLDPESVAPLNEMPAWLGPISRKRIFVDRHQIT